MTWRTHAVGGVAALWLLAPVPGAVTAGNAGLLAAATALGALLPDLDAADAKARRLSLAGIQPLEPLGALLHGLFGHRGILHALAGLSLFFLLVALPLSLWWGPAASLALFLGYASHLALDACTVRGVPLLPERRADGRWGFFRSRHLLPRRLRVATGSPPEDAIFAVMAGLALLLLLRALRAGA